jgi:hypothetical protein
MGTMLQDSILRLKLWYLYTKVKGIIPEEVSLYGRAFDLYLGGACLGFWPGHHQVLPRHLWVYLVTAGKCQVCTLEWAMTTSFTDVAFRYLQSSIHPSMPCSLYY